jgi:hypothetical protein
MNKATTKPDFELVDVSSPELKLVDEAEILLAERR